MMHKSQKMCVYKHGLWNIQRHAQVMQIHKIDNNTRLILKNNSI